METDYSTISDPTTLGLNSRHEAQLLLTLEQLLGVDTTEVGVALDQVSQLLSGALRADKIDIFLYDATNHSLVARGTSDTPMGRKQHALGLERQPVANGGRVVQVFETGDAWYTGQADRDPEELRGIKEGLGIHSILDVPLEVNGERRGVIGANSAQPNHFTPDDLLFLTAVADWIGIILHRAELMEHTVRIAAEQARRLAADELVTILAHDLRGPLTPIRGRVEMLQRRAEKEGHQRNLQDVTSIKHTLLRLEGMISDLLDTARLEQGIFALNPQFINLASLVHEVADTLQTPNNDITVRAPDEVMITVDPQRIRQVLENLITNARTHAESSTPIVLELGTEQRDTSAWAVVAVHDAGPGIAPEILPHLFTRFASSQKTRGLGLGLYLARGIVEAHAGEITVESLPGQGTTFRIALPPPREDG